ncbi:MAG: ABC transporter ATP-binding protein [Ruminococcaceae bacterium]|nr:ABC transporter ATP-binding protein [Oscillospiraceae bacterium]
MKNTFARVLSYIKKSIGLLIVTLILALAIVAMTLYLPILIGDAIDLCIDGNVDLDAIVNLLIKAAAVVGLTALLQWIMSIINNNITYRIVRDIRRDAIRKIQKLPLSYIDSHQTGETVNRVISDVDTFSDGLLMGFTQFFTGIITIIGTLVVLFIIDWRIALFVAALTPLSLFVAKFIAEHTHDFFLAQSKTKAEQTAFVNETVSEQKVSIAFSHGDENIEKFEEINNRLSKAALKATFYSSLTNPSTRVVNNLVYFGVALLGGFFCIGVAPSMTIGNLAVCLRYANQYTKPFNEISGVITELQNALACASRIFELLDAKEIEPDHEDAAAPDKINGNIVFKDVCFSYTPEKKLIENFNFSADHGQRIAIVGPTGCGKTTLINLLMRFYNPTSGEITIDSISTRNLKRATLRKNFGMVLQDTWLREGTIRDNITMGKPDATDEEVITAAKAAHAHGFIKNLPNGYDTYIGEDGGALSAGQKQLLCITRIMLCLPPMLILDEATSSIDTRTEMRIQNAFATLMKGRTSFIVAHRLSTIREADVILVMKDGNIIEQGSHSELLNKGGFYAELWNAQFVN